MLSYDLLEWHFEAVKGNRKFVGNIIAEKNHMVRLNYTAPDGSSRFCHNTKVANMMLQVFKRQGGYWVPFKTLSSKQTTAYETVSRQADTSITLVA